jgi:hypothetical protein
MKNSWIVGGTVSALLLAACSSSDITASAANQLTAIDALQSVALSASDATAEDIDIMSAADGSMNATAITYDRIGVAPAAMTSASAGGDSVRFAFWSFSQNCTFSATTGRFTCPDVVKNGLTLSHSAALFDASGVAMTRYNDTTTASANFQTTVSGVHVTTNGADTLSRQRTMTVAGLLGHETSRTWNGTGTRSDAGYHQDGEKTRTYHTTDAVTFASVLVNLPRSVNPWPISGTVTRQIAGSGTVVNAGTTRSFTMAKTVTITFNGTHLVPMMVGSAAFTLDLLTGKATKN